MRFVINTSTIDVSLNEAERVKLAADDSHQRLVKCINSVLKDISLPAIDASDCKVDRSEGIIDDASNHHRLCFNYVHPMSASVDILQINDICSVVTVENTTVLRTQAGIALRIAVNKNNSCYSLSNIIYQAHCAEYDLGVEVTFGEQCIDLYRESFMRMILDMDADATVLGANTVVSKVIKLESIDVGVAVYDSMFTKYPPKNTVFNALPVFVNYNGRGFFIKHITFDTVGRYNIFVGKDKIGKGYCYAPGYVRMEESFQADTPIVANNIVQLEQCMAITGAVNEKIVANGPDNIEVIDQVNWYANNVFYESELTNDVICSKISKAVVCSVPQINDFIGGAPGYDRLYNIFSEIKLFKESSGELEISDKEVIKLLCDGLGINLGGLGSVSADVHQKGRRTSAIIDALNTLNLRALPVDVVAEAYYCILEQIVPLEEHGMNMEDVIIGILHVMVDTGVCSPVIIRYAIEEFDELTAVNNRRRSSGEGRNRRSSPRDIYGDHRNRRGRSTFQGGMREQCFRKAYDEALKATVHADKVGSRLYSRLFRDIEELVNDYNDVLYVSEVVNIIAYTLNKYSGSNPYMVQCSNNSLDYIIGDIVKEQSDKLSAAAMLEFINPASVHEVISRIDTYVDELRTYIVEDGKVHM